MNKNCSILLRVGLALVLGVVATVPPYVQSEAFDLTDNVSFRGGYAGIDAAILVERDIRRCERIFSGDLNGRALRAFAASLLVEDCVLSENNGT